MRYNKHLGTISRDTHDTPNRTMPEDSAEPLLLLMVPVELGREHGTHGAHGPVPWDEPRMGA